MRNIFKLYVEENYQGQIEWQPPHRAKTKQKSI